MVPINLVFLAPLALFSGIGHGVTVSATAWWLKACGVSYTKIGIFNIANLAYGLRLFWIPIFDQIDITKYLRAIGIRSRGPLQRKGFIVICVVLTAVAIYIASLADPKSNIMTLALPIAFASFWISNGDSIMSAYVYETLQPRDMGLSTAAYRIGFFASSAAALFIYETFGIPWATIFRFASILMLILGLSIIFAPQEKAAQVKTWQEAFINPYRDIIKQYGYQMLVIIAFMGLYKAQERFCAPMEQMFLRNECSLGRVGYFVLKLISTFTLAFSAVKSGPLISKFGYKGAFLTSVIANASIMACYFLHTLKSTQSYLLCIVINSALLVTFYRLTVKKGSKWYVVLLATMYTASFLLKDLVIAHLASISAFLIVITAKMISGIRSSLLYSYQNALCSKEHALTQITLMVSIERVLVGDIIQTLSGACVDKFSWSGFYMINICISLLPLLLIGFTRYPTIKQH